MLRSRNTPHPPYADPLHIAIPCPPPPPQPLWQIDTLADRDSHAIPSRGARGGPAFSICCPPPSRLSHSQPPTGGSYPSRPLRPSLFALLLSHSYIARRCKAHAKPPAAAIVLFWVLYNTIRFGVLYSILLCALHCCIVLCCVVLLHHILHALKSLSRLLL